MTDRKSIFVIRRGRHSPVGYVEGNEAFDASGTKRCKYDPAGGNLFDSESGKIIGYVSLSGQVVGTSWIIDEFFQI